VSDERSKPARQPRRVHCWVCGREVSAAPSELRRFAVTGFPRCCGQDMQAGPPAAPVPSFPDRLGRRWLARRGVRTEVRRESPPDMADLGLGLIDVSADGACVRLTAPVERGEEVRVRLRRRGSKKAVEIIAETRWCRPEGGGVYVAGLRLRRRLTPAELTQLAR
jgi:hypothetical protein